MRRCASAVAAKKKSVVVNTFQSFNQTRVVFLLSFLPSHRQTWDQAEGCDLLPGHRRGLLRSPPQCHKGTQKHSFSLISFTHSLFSSHIFFHFQHVCAHSALLLFSVLLLWPAAVTEGIFQLEYDDQCMYPHSVFPCLSSLSPVCPNHRPDSVIDNRRRSPAERLLLHASHASLILCSLNI